MDLWRADSARPRIRGLFRLYRCIVSGFEIERKFLVKDGRYKEQAFDSSRIRQGYICSGHGRTVRVRIRDTRGYLTIKGPSTNGGLSRYEFEPLAWATFTSPERTPSL